MQWEMLPWLPKWDIFTICGRFHSAHTLQSRIFVSHFWIVWTLDIFAAMTASMRSLCTAGATLMARTAAEEPGLCSPSQKSSSHRRSSPASKFLLSAMTNNTSRSTLERRWSRRWSCAGKLQLCLHECEYYMPPFLQHVWDPCQHECCNLGLSAHRRAHNKNRKQPWNLWHPPKIRPKQPPQGIVFTYHKGTLKLPSCWFQENADLLVSMRGAIFFDSRKKGVNQVLISMGIGELLSLRMARLVHKFGLVAKQSGIDPSDDPSVLHWQRFPSILFSKSNLLRS